MSSLSLLKQIILTVILGLFACGNNPAQAGDEGVNDSFMSSIGSPDRPPEVGAVKRTVELCKKSLMSELWMTIFGKLPSNEIKIDEENSDGFNESDGYRDFFRFYSTINVTSNVTETEIIKISRKYFEIRVANQRGSNTPTTKRSTSLVAQSPIWEPLFIYEEAVVDQKYDDFGDLISSRILAKDLKLINGDNSDLTDITFRNFQNPSATVKFVLNLKSYRDCLINELQRQVSKGNN